MSTSCIGTCDACGHEAEVSPSHYGPADSGEDYAFCVDSDACVTHRLAVTATPVEHIDGMPF